MHVSWEHRLAGILSRPGSLCLRTALFLLAVASVRKEMWVVMNTHVEVEKSGIVNSPCVRDFESQWKVSMEEESVSVRVFVLAWCVICCFTGVLPCVQLHAVLVLPGLHWNRQQNTCKSDTLLEALCHINRYACTCAYHARTFLCVQLYGSVLQSLHGLTSCLLCEVILVEWVN